MQRKLSIDHHNFFLNHDRPRTIDAVTPELCDPELCDPELCDPLISMKQQVIPPAAGRSCLLCSHL